MKFDPDLIREILIAVSESISPDEYGFVPQIPPVKLVQEKLSDYPQSEVLYWIRRLMESDLLIQGKAYVNEPIPRIKDLSLSGYQFVQNTSKSSIWKEIRPQLIGTAISSLPNFVQCAIKLGSTVIAKYPDIHL